MLLTAAQEGLAPGPPFFWLGTSPTHVNIELMSVLRLKFKASWQGKSVKTDQPLRHESRVSWTETATSATPLPEHLAAEIASATQSVSSRQFEVSAVFHRVTATGFLGISEDAQSIVDALVAESREPTISKRLIKPRSR